MDDIGFAIGWFIFAFGVHILVHRLFSRYKTVLFFFSGIYLLGIPLIIFKHATISSSYIHLPVSACFISFIIGCIAIIFYLPRLLDGQTPSTVLFSAFKMKPYWKKRELLDLFTEKNVIDVRLHMLKEKNILTVKNGMICLTLKGRILFLIFSTALKISGMEAGG